MIAMIQRAGAAAALILTLLSGCDNVSWGGADVTIIPPPPRASGEPPTGLEPGVERLPEGPILFLVTTEGRGGVIRPVAEISADSLRTIRPGVNVGGFADAFIAEHLRQGAEFVLFHGGMRAGTLIVQSAALEGEPACRPMPVARGALELGAGAEGVTEFLALARLQAPQVPRRTGDRLEPTRTMQVLGPILAEQMLRKRRGPLPSNWQRAMAQLRPFPVPGSQNAGFTATFLMSDTLGPGLDDEGHSLFFVAIPSQLSFDTVHVDYRVYAQDGKQAPRVIDHLDWDRDDSAELLLRVYGVDDSWLEAVGRGADGRWRRIFSNRCARVAPLPMPDTLAADPPPEPPSTESTPRPTTGTGALPPMP
jgi:hypothetical protein